MMPFLPESNLFRQHLPVLPLPWLCRFFPGNSRRRMQRYCWPVLHDRYDGPSPPRYVTPLQAVHEGIKRLCWGTPWCCKIYLTPVVMPDTHPTFPAPVGSAGGYWMSSSSLFFFIQNTLLIAGNNFYGFFIKPGWTEEEGLISSIASSGESRLMSSLFMPADWSSSPPSH